MDLGAYINIDNEDIEEIVRRNNITVPRLRGYRLMKNENLIEIFSETVEEITKNVVKDAIHSVPVWKPNSSVHEYSWERTQLEKKYIINGQIQWNKIHGKRRKEIKHVVKQQLKDIKHNLDTFNKYVGRDDVLYIHARIGGGNWPYYYKEVVNQPWFIEKVDDYFDSTYCDIYARIK